LPLLSVGIAAAIAACAPPNNDATAPAGAGGPTPPPAPSAAVDGGVAPEGGGSSLPHQACPAAKFSLAAPVPYTAGLGARVMVAGDMNGDGKADLVIGNPLDTVPPNDNPSVGIFLGNGDGTFAAMKTSPYPPHAPVDQTVSLGDLDGDGKPDVIGFGQD